jgi:hypothetical protein
MSDSTETQSTVLLKQAQELFEAGNYAEARRLAERIGQSDQSELREGAAELLARLEPAPLTKSLLLLTGVLLLAVTVFAYTK